ncbi:MAG: type III pantothenate kinase [Candidatus Coatesbacteria bacterium]|nr:MAG: type III pantothenate kinase [Candidatus Coatesbacteria bacterium]
MAPHLLALDVGNTFIAGGYFMAGRLVFHFQVASDTGRSADEYGLRLRQLVELHGGEAGELPSVLCSVVPPLTAALAEALARYFGAAPVVVGDDYEALGIDVRYENPAEVGPDRVVNALATRELYGAPAVVVDFGTATTFDVVSAEGAYVGGVIAPGVAVSAQNLFERAARLAPVDFTLPPRVVGRNTEEALRAGIILGAARAADGIVEAIQEERGERGFLVATGGLAAVVAPVMTTAPRLDAELTLKGLALVYERLTSRGEQTS